jgi:glucose/mannose-6-phosphate isomerase
MKSFVAQFGPQLLDALDRLKTLKNIKPSSPIQNIVISGLGGSGIGGSFIADYFNHIKCKTPVFVNKGYDVPAFINTNTLFIACSYSGNTEETLEAIEKAAKAKAQICVITSGGKLATIAGKKNYPVITLPTGFPPRAAFAYSSTALLKAMNMFGVTKTKFETEIYETVGLLTEEAKSIATQAKAVAKKLLNKQLFLYCADGNEAITVRFRQQLNENSKVLACHHVYPEMNHNELVGWRTKDAIAVINLFTGYEHKRTKARFDITKPIIKKYAKEVIDINAHGETFLSKSLYLVHLCDMISCELADLRKVDAVEVKVIDHLKGALTKL